MNNNLNLLALKFNHIKQQDQRDSGPTCLRMITKFYGNEYSIQEIRALSKITRDGVSFPGLEEAAISLGFEAERIRVDELCLEDIQLPCILNWRLSHYVVLYQIKNAKYYIADPTKGKVCLRRSDFHDLWFSRKEFAGICLVLKPSSEFTRKKKDEHADTLNLFRKLASYTSYRTLFRQLIIGFLLGSIFQLATPFLTQAIVDQGIYTKDIEIVYIILIAQLMLVIGNMGVNFIRSWILLGISTKINISLLSQFLYKLINLPITFFESKTEGDIIQRMSDQQKIESFLTGTAINTLFSSVNLVIFSSILAYYNTIVFIVFICTTVLYTGWILLFLKPKRELNYLQFENAAMNQSSVIEIINGIQDVKLSLSEEQKRWEWEELQVILFRYKRKLLKINQMQSAGSIFINQVKNILITFLSVRAVIAGELTLGGMMAIQYIVGQINNPIEQFLNFLQVYQDASISLERLEEIHGLRDEIQKSEDLITDIPLDKSISIRNLSFHYPASGSKAALNNITLFIPEGKVTAIVGMSGSGKTTLLKLLLKFYDDKDGTISIGDTNLDEIDNRFWRSKCGTVLTDAYIFNDTIANNISLGDHTPDIAKINISIHTANLTEFIESLPSGIETKIGNRGNRLSLGQKQRLLIARAVYKNPDYLFFDEATNALDSINEEIIMKNLKAYFHRKTVVFVAHRLSTVRDADQIVVLDKSRIVECGRHQDLVDAQGIYYHLIKNQLAIGA